MYADNRERRPGCYLVSRHLWTETLGDVFITRAFHQRGERFRPGFFPPRSTPRQDCLHHHRARD
jgi:hypothetical protein